MSTPRPPGTGSRASSRLIALAIIVVFIGVSVLGAVAGRPPAHVPISGAEAYLATDGSRVLLTGPRSTQVRWTSHQPGIRPMVDGPTDFVSASLADPDSGRSAAWVVESEDDGPGTQPHLMRVDSDGIRTWTSMWPEARTFTPGRLEIPASPQAGQRITTTGTATNERGTVTYSSTLKVFDASGAGPGCLEFRRSDRIGEGPAQLSNRTRCPGRGVVALTLPLSSGDQATWVRTPTWPRELDPRPGLDLTDPLLGGSLAGLRSEVVTFERGGLVTLVPPAGRPHLIGDQLVIASAQTGNVVWAKPAEPTVQGASDARFTPGAWASVSGDLLTSARCGEVFVVATSQRRLVAHAGSGRWIWTTEFADVAGSEPVRSGENLLVATKDGQLHAVSCREGGVVWSAEGLVSQLSPAVGPRGVLAADETGVRLLDTGDGTSHWTRTLPDRVTALAQIDRFAFVGDDSHRLFVLDGATGDVVTVLTLPDVVEAIHVIGDGYVLRTDTRVIGLSPWRTTWSLPFTGRASLADGTHVAVASLSELVVLDDSGMLVGRRPLAVNPRAADVQLSPTTDGFLAADGVGTIVRWRR
ncbi:MAG: PQQ-binding-like beta-propeller repeat protein [Propionibacteriaceae bacterium]|nr:PQQ-binding-like beta-propeller repeat protein [Propionibacteriaceae bacterium]